MLLKEMFLELSWCDLKQEINLLRVLSTGVHVWVQKQKGRIWQTSKQGEQTRELEMKSQNNKHWLWILGNRMNKVM